MSNLPIHARTCFNIRIISVEGNTEDNWIRGQKAIFLEGDFQQLQSKIKINKNE